MMTPLLILCLFFVGPIVGFGDRGSRGRIVREGTVLTHDRFTLRLIRPLGDEDVAEELFLEMPPVTLTQEKALGSGAFGTVWMCELEVSEDCERRGEECSFPKKVAAKIMNHIPTTEEMEEDQSAETDCAGPKVWPVPVTQAVNSFFRESAFAESIRTLLPPDIVKKHFIGFYGLYFLEEKPSESEERDHDGEDRGASVDDGQQVGTKMNVVAEGSNQQMAVLMLEVMDHMNDASCVPAKGRSCHWEFTKFVSDRRLKDMFLRHGAIIVRDLEAVASALGEHSLVHHDIWEDNVIVRCKGEPVECTALLIDFGVSIDCNKVKTDVEAPICESRSQRSTESREPSSSRAFYPNDPPPEVLTAVTRSASEGGARQRREKARVRRRRQSVPATFRYFQEDDLVRRLKSGSSMTFDAVDPQVRDSDAHPDDYVPFSYRDGRCCTDLFRGYFNSYFSRHDPALVEDATHNAGKTVCAQMRRDAEAGLAGKMDLVMVLTMLEKVLGLQFGNPRWDDEPDELADAIRESQEFPPDGKIAWLVEAIRSLRERLNYHVDEPL